MDFASALIEGVLIRRYKRFFADVQLPNGEIVVAHCANTGAMTGCAEPGFKVWLSPANNPKRKLQYTWELAQNSEQQWIGVNTANANRVVEEALQHNKVKELCQFNQVKREYKPENATSRFDFLLTQDDAVENNQRCLVEVKSVTLCDGNLGYFPDAVTTRGAKHCRELAEYVSNDTRCVLLFCVQHSGVEQVKIAQHIDPDYNQSLQLARDAGVEVLAYKCKISDKKILLIQSLPVVF